jgi:hypothetical protein
VIVGFVDIGGFVDHHCLSLLFIITIVQNYLTRCIVRIAAIFMMGTSLKNHADNWRLARVYIVHPGGYNLSIQFI